MHRRWALIAMLALAACSPSASASPSPSEGAPSAEPTASEATASEAATASGTITLADEGAAVDGPGVRIDQALDPNRVPEPLLVNGILLQDLDGTIWLCQRLSDASPPACVGAFLRVENFPGDAAATTFDPDNADVTGLQEEGGVVWLEGQQLYGTVEPN